MSGADRHHQEDRGTASDGAAADAVVANSLTVATWTVVSRVTGLARITVVAAVLGPTYFGNTFEATNLLPNLTYEFLTGALFTSLLVPPLVRHIDDGDPRAVERVAGGFLGIALVAFLVATLALTLAGPLLLRVLTIGVDDPSVVSYQLRVGWPLIAMLMPQILLYGTAATGAAVMNAHGRFALAAAAPAFESLGVIATMGANAYLFGTAPSLETVTTPQLLLLGLGTTAAVGLHAGAQCWGARRIGVRLRPRAGWRDAEVREVMRRALPSLGYAGLNSLRVFAVLVVANRVAGGVVAFRLALNFFYLPVAVWARPVAVALLPRLARLAHTHAERDFHGELVRGASLVAFLTVPAAVSYVVLAQPLAQAVAFGQMDAPAGIALVAASLAALGPGVLGEAAFVTATHASYAREEADAPFRSMIVRTGVAIAGMLVAFLQPDGASVLVALGLAVSAGNIVSAWHLSHRLRSRLVATGERLAPPLARAFVASALMALPVHVVATSVPTLVDQTWGDVAGILVAVPVGLAIFLVLQWAWRSPELGLLRQGFSELRPAEGR